MPLFGGFRFSLNLSSSHNLSTIAENSSPVSIEGAYKLNREEFFGTGSYGEPPKKITPSMVKLPPPFQPDPTERDVNGLSKSTGDITQSINTLNLPPNLRKSTPEVSSDPSGGNTASKRNSTDVRKIKNKSNKNEEKELKRLDKKKEIEQKKREKLEAQERAKQEKLEKARQKAELQEQAKQEKLRKEKEKTEALKAKKEKGKTKEPKPNKKEKTAKLNNPLAQAKIVPTNSLAYNSNTLNSSISKTSGPPPYNDINKPGEVSNTIVKNENDDTGNTSFGKPIDEGDTWDMVAQHRAQISRTPAATTSNKVKLRLQEPDDTITGRKSLYV